MQKPPRKRISGELWADSYELGHDGMSARGRLRPLDWQGASKLEKRWPRTQEQPPEGRTPR